MSSTPYAGTELEVFKEAHVWKGYFGSFLRAYLTGHVLEVGSGLGANTIALRTDQQATWLCLEPDSALAEIARERIDAAGVPVCDVECGTLQDLSNKRRFDVVLYLDVLEHIEHDGQELHTATSFLNTGGHLIVLAPAVPWLFSEFDHAIGHYRRYTRKTLLAAAPAALRLERLCYLDVVGLTASAANRILMRRANPSRTQILFWDRVLVRASKLFDLLVLRRLGRSILSVWQKAEQPDEADGDEHE